MKEAAAYVLCFLGGNESPDAASISKIITAAGGEPDEEKITLLLKELEGKSPSEVRLGRVRTRCLCWKSAWPYFFRRDGWVANISRKMEFSLILAPGNVPLSI
jgi:hypothetical protein